MFLDWPWMRDVEAQPMASPILNLAEISAMHHFPVFSEK